MFVRCRIIVKFDKTERTIGYFSCTKFHIVAIFGDSGLKITKSKTCTLKTRGVQFGDLLQVCHTFDDLQLHVTLSAWIHNLKSIENVNNIVKTVNVFMFSLFVPAIETQKSSVALLCIAIFIIIKQLPNN